MSWQEYFIRKNDGCTLDEESEKHKLTQCLIAAIERRVSHVHLRYKVLAISYRKILWNLKSQLKEL